LIGMATPFYSVVNVDGIQRNINCEAGQNGPVCI